METANHYFNINTLTFLKKLAENNNRDWFEENKGDYEAMIRTPALNFIQDMAGDLALQSPHFLALPRKVGGSLMRVYRDVRFGKDKTPYKTNIGIQFRHERGKDVHAPGFYLHIEPHASFVGVGIWRPDSAALTKIRESIAENNEDWEAITKNKAFRQQFEQQGESLVRPPRGYSADHPLIEDLKRKDFIAVSPLTSSQVTASDLFNVVIDRFHAADEYMRFLCKALELAY